MCNCIDTVNKSLKKKGVELDVPYLPQRVTLAVRARSVVGKLFRPTIFATFCPFCGKPYPGSLAGQLGTKKESSRANIN